MKTTLVLIGTCCGIIGSRGLLKGISIGIACVEALHHLRFDEMHTVELITKRDPVGTDIMRTAEKLDFARARREALNDAVDLVGFVRCGANL